MSETPKAAPEAPKRGLPVQLADGNTYFFQSLRLGPKGDAGRAVIRKLTDLSIDLARITDSYKHRSQEAGAKLPTLMAECDAETQKHDERRRNLVLDLAVELLKENYPEEGAARKIAEELTPPTESVVLSIARTGDYPEGFTPTSS